MATFQSKTPLLYDFHCDATPTLLLLVEVRSLCISEFTIFGWNGQTGTSFVFPEHSVLTLPLPFMYAFYIFIILCLCLAEKLIAPQGQIKLKVK